MTNSTPITVFHSHFANQNVKVCNARELHAYLESKTQFGNWITDRINDYGFIEDQDYIIVYQHTHGRPRKEYHITLDMGKELGMVERNEKGRQIRRYFIELERRAKQPTPEAILTERLPLTLDSTQQSQLIALLNYVHYFITEVWTSITTLYPHCGASQSMHIADMQILTKLLQRHLAIKIER
ncbi:MAG: antA/AntB antirepressor family protein [[Pasteurella] mairii]|uniref:Phage anti-repressor protein n=1 Tax=[Pasteurella] mairii TaxID=757 RepID=A0A379B5K5_9PAST|nr:antA/AntB antirepressor family protein [[Pasteurella] mairii]SUB33539.1 Phage anti-repressor protein [[Pasteurella] mairii]